MGAGVNFGTHNDAGETFPLASELSARIARDLLNDAELKSELSETAEMARYAVGEKTLNDYLFKLFSSFNPGTAHLALAQLPWDVIYTTNYDLLVERAFVAGTVVPSGELRQIFSTATDLTSFTESDILYYKLHGSVDHANTAEGRLIITKEDYRFYESHRKLLFARLKRDIQGKTFVFVGYALRDDNFLTILDDIRAVLDTKSLPLSFAVRRAFRPGEEAFWREKYNIQLVDEDAAVFLTSLKDSWFAENRVVLPLHERASWSWPRQRPLLARHDVQEVASIAFPRARSDDAGSAGFRWSDEAGHS